MIIMQADNYRISKRGMILTLALVTGIMLLYTMITNISIYEVLSSINPLLIIFALIIYFLGWLVSAIRLKVIHICLDGAEKKLSIKDYFYARLLGGFLANITPSAIGGEPARAYYISRKTKGPFSRYFALAMYEVLYDIMLVNVVALALSIVKLPYSIPVIIVSIGSMGFWLIMYYVMCNMLSPETAKFPLNKIIKYVGKFGENRFFEAFKDYGSSFRYIVDKTDMFSKIIVIALTFMYQFMNALVIYVLLQDHSITSLINAVMAYFFALSLGALPTPGGAGSIEYGLSLTLPPGIVVVARGLMFYSIIIAGIVIVYVTRIYREIISSDRK